MRLRACLLALAVLAATAGCLGDRGGTPPPVATTPAATPSPEPSPTPTPPPTASTPEPTVPSGTPAPPPPKVVYNRSFDFSTEGDPTGQSPKTHASEPVGVEHSVLAVNVTLVRSSGAPTPLPISGTINSPAVRVLDPDGQEILVETREGTSRLETFPAKSGAYSVRYEGAGTLRATVVLTATT